jgi:CDP-diacylglycerol--glycerol-3-phosphate 3-phosphatidyltransferase
VIAAPCVVLAFVFFTRPLADWIAFWLFVGAALTDFLDGWLARRLNQQSALGTMLDPIADKAMVIIALTVLMTINPVTGGSTEGVIFPYPGMEIAVPAVIIIMREILVTGLREFLGDVKLPVTMLAKWKTTFQMIAIAVLFLRLPISLFDSPDSAGVFGRAPFSQTTEWLLYAGTILLWFAAILTAITGWDYFAKGIRHIRDREGH